jgi:uncharacterized protein (DUF1697 family)
MPGSAERATGLKTYVALLRGINLAGRNRVSMADLRKVFGALGAEDVATYLQSGNVVFKSRVKKPAELIEGIEAGVARELGLQVKVLLCGKAELAKVLAENPLAGSGRDPQKLHVTFLSETPARARVRALDPKLGEPDEFRVVGRRVYLHCPNGYGKTKLGNAYLEKQLGVAATTRSWKTVTKLAELAARA